ncbi:MAG: hypothetical protein R3F19_16010 [Verrucomicrobiales bacterium]
MNDHPFETRLRAHRQRKAPADWKADILQAAEAAASGSKRKHLRSIAWATLAACWVLIGISHWQGELKDVQLAQGIAPPDPNHQPPPIPSPEETEALFALLFPEEIVKFNTAPLP